MSGGAKRSVDLIAADPIVVDAVVEPARADAADTGLPAADTYDGHAGHVDRLDGRTLDGWAQVPFMPHIVAVVEFLVDGAVVGLSRANLFRRDLRDAGIRDGFAGFRFAIPKELCDGRRHTLEVRERLCEKALGGVAEFCLEAPRDRPHRGEIFLNSVTLADDTGSAAFANALTQRRRLAIFCTFSPDNLLYGHHHRMIDALRAAGFAVLLGQSRAGAEFIERGALAPPPSRADAVLIKENLGYDFGTWLAAFVAVREHVPKLDELLLINDSVFGPLFDFAAFAGTLAARREDVVGLCDSYDSNYHLQSFFLLLRAPVLKDGALDRFSADYPYSDNKGEVVRDGELALTPFLMRAGFSCAALYPYEELAKAWLKNLPAYLADVEALPENAGAARDGRKCDEVEYLLNLARHIRRGDPVNPSHAFWEILLELKCPFIKRELLFKNPTGHSLLYRAPAAIEATGYPLDLIRESARRFGASKVFI